jgi:hypothetical protein
MIEGFTPIECVFFVALFFNVTTINLNDVTIAALEFHMKVSFRFGEGEVALIAHNALYQYFSAASEYAHRYARGRTAVGETTLAGDCFVAVVIAVTDRCVCICELQHAGRQEQGIRNCSCHSGGSSVFRGNLHFDFFTSSGTLPFVRD